MNTGSPNGNKRDQTFWLKSRGWFHNGSAWISPAGYPRLLTHSTRAARDAQIEWDGSRE